MRLPNNPLIPCFLCGKVILVKISKSHKPYFICDQCGLQAFVRISPGIRRLEEILKAYSAEDSDFQVVNRSAFETFSLVSRLLELRRALDKIADDKSIAQQLFGDRDLEVMQKAVRNEIRKIHNSLGNLD